MLLVSGHLPEATFWEGSTKIDLSMCNHVRRDDQTRCAAQSQAASSPFTPLFIVPRACALA
eukprot:4368879-Pleurochrysis_carterae.AAC.1